MHSQKAILSILSLSLFHHPFQIICHRTEAKNATFKVHLYPPESFEGAGYTQRCAYRRPWSIDVKVLMQQKWEFGVRGFGVWRSWCRWGWRGGRSARRRTRSRSPGSWTLATGRSWCELECDAGWSILYSQANAKIHILWVKQVRKVVWTRKRVRATAVTAGHCTHAELTSGHALASCCSWCVHSRVYANKLANYWLIRK